METETTTNRLAFLGTMATGAAPCKKIILTPLFLFFICLSIYSQKKFFESVEVNSYVYFDDLKYDKNNWRDQFKPPIRPSVQKFDSLSYYPLMREGFFLPILNGGWGAQIRLLKRIPVFTLHPRRSPVIVTEKNILKEQCFS